MLYPIEITKPFADMYGSKKRIRLPQEIKVIKSVSLNIIDLKTFYDILETQPVSVTIMFDLCKFSLLLNNGNDEVISDATMQLSLFQYLSNGWLQAMIIEDRKTNAYYMQRVILNKKIIRNSVHYAVFKMPDNLLQYIAFNSAAKAFGDYLRSDDFKLMLYVEAS